MLKGKNKIIDYIVVSSSKCNYQKWQLELMEWSMKKISQPGKLVVLLSEDKEHENEDVQLNLSDDVDIVNLPDWAEDWGKSKSWGGIPNKYESINWICDKNYFKDSDVLLFLDPDMIFVDKVVDMIPNENQIIAQRWVDYPGDDNFYKERGSGNYKYSEGVMFPFIIRFDDLKSISKDYKKFTIDYRIDSGKWESEMVGFDSAAKKYLEIEFVDDLGRCVTWDKVGSKNISNLIHYASPMMSKRDKLLFRKTDYTFDKDKTDYILKINQATNEIDKSLLTNITQQNTDYMYHIKWDFDKIFNSYNGSNGYLAFHQYKGGLNNVRHSLEIAVCICYLTNRTLLVPDLKIDNWMGLRSDTSYIPSFYNIKNLGIKSILLSHYCFIRNIEPTYEEVKSKSKLIEYPITDNKIINFTKNVVPDYFSRGRGLESSNIWFDDSELIFLDSNLLGCFYQLLYTDVAAELKMIVAKYVRYKNEIFDQAWKLINVLGDQKYYSIHIRGGDYQYKDLRMKCKDIYRNIKNIIPYKSILYISTDIMDNNEVEIKRFPEEKDVNADKSYFKALEDNYSLVFYSDLEKMVDNDIPVNWIPAIEQLICARGIKFVGMKLSTFSSYIFRLRGYMNDIEDKNFYEQQYSDYLDKQITYKEEDKWWCAWAREYKDAWDFTK